MPYHHNSVKGSRTLDSIAHAAQDGRRNIYVASSWQNQLQPRVVEVLRAHGHQVYDFKHPSTTADREFHWEDLFVADPNPIDGRPPPMDRASATSYLAALTHPAAALGFQRDVDAMLAADTFVLVLPCGRSAHLELGWAVGAGKRTAILLEDPCTPELMYMMADRITTSLDDLLEWLTVSPGRENTPIWLPPETVPHDGPAGQAQSRTQFVLRRRGWVRLVDRPGQDWAGPKSLLGIWWRVAFALHRILKAALP